MIKVGIAGLGFMGWIHWLAYQKTDGVQVAAIATPEPERLQGDWTGIRGNFGPPGEKVDLSDVATYSSLVEMLANNELDVIDICLPPAFHRDAIIQTVQSGKHAFCEKPLGLNLADCDLAIRAVQSANKLLFVGHVLPFFVEFQYVRQLAESRKYGRPIGGYFKRIISDPLWLTKFYDPNVIGGPLFDLHVHDAHFIRLLFGKPSSIHSIGRSRGQVVEFCHSIFHFEHSDATVASTMGVINQQGRPFTHGFEVHFEKATVHFEFSALAEPNSPELNRLKIFTDDGKVVYPELGDGDPVHAFEREIAEVITSISNGSPSRILAGPLARDAVEICERQSMEIFR